MKFKIAYLSLAISLLGITSQANAFGAAIMEALEIMGKRRGPFLPPDIVAIREVEKDIRDITNQDKYVRHLSKIVCCRNYRDDPCFRNVEHFTTSIIITFSEIGLVYKIPTLIDKGWLIPNDDQQYFVEKSKEKLALYRTKNYGDAPELAHLSGLAKIADVTLSNAVERLTHPEEKLSLFAQTRDVLEQEMNSTSPYLKWMAYRVVARTAADEGKLDEADILLSEVLRELPSQYKPNVEKIRRSLQGKFNKAGS